MAKGRGLAVLALFIGISGLGLGLYSVFYPQVQNGGISESGIQKTWFKYDSWPHFTYPIYTDKHIDALTINFTINEGESVYYFLSTHAYVISGSISSIVINFVLDGVLLSSPEYPDAIFSSNNAASSGAVTLQMATNNISAGLHNITISIRGNFQNNAIDESTLLVQTYIP